MNAPSIRESFLKTRIDGGWGEGRNWPAIGVVLALHAGLLWGLMQIESVRAAVQDAMPIMVGLITVPTQEPVKPKIEPLRPKLAPVKLRPEPQMIVVETAAAVAIEAPPPEPVPVEEPPPPPVAEPAPPAPLIPPNFVAAYLDNPAPAYPLSSKRLGETGMVMLRVRVNALGRPDSVEVERSSGYARLDRAALDAVRHWKFVPAKQGDQAVPASVLVPLNFELSNT